MKVRDIAFLIIGGALLLLIAIYAMRVAQYYPAARAELGRVKVMQIADETKAKLQSLEHDVLVTYYVSGREHMPSNMRRLERQVVDLLRAMRDASEGRLDYQILDPETDEDLKQHAAHQRIAPFRVRSVRRDAYTEQSVWSSLHINYGSHEPAVINGVSPAHLPRLQSIIVGQLEQMDDPREPVFGVSAPDEYRHFQSYLRRFGEVVMVDETLRDLSRDIDVLFWLEPTDVTPDIIRRLDRFMNSGRSAVVAGSQHAIDVHRENDTQRFELRPTDYDAEVLLGAFGLRPIDGLVLDTHAERVPGDVAPRPVPFLIRCIPPNQDFRQMRDILNGHMLFAAPTPLALDGDVLRERGYEPVVVATTSDNTTVRDMVYGMVDLDRAEFHEGDPTAKLPLMVWLRPHEPWRGSLLVSASSSPFRDGSFALERFAHRKLIHILSDTLASDERLVMHRAGIETVQPLPEMSLMQRIGWRFAVILLVPLGVLALALYRGVFTIDSFPRSVQAAQSTLPLRAGAGVMAALVLVAVVGGAGWRADLTEGRLNELTPATHRIAERATTTDPIEITLYFSPIDQLPPSLRPHVRQVQTVLRELQRRDAKLNITWVRPENLTAEERTELEERDIRPFRITTEDETATVVRNIYSTIVLESGDRREVLRFSDRRSFDHIEFRMAFAMWRLETGHTPHIAFAADAPRLSAAEVYHDFQERGFMAPSGTDVYALARDVLRQNDFKVTHINPRRPNIPDDVDLIIWTQPRRDILPLLDQVVQRLHEGVPVMIAGQHFNIQSRQYRGDEFRAVYWPQPQVVDIHRHYFPALGVELVREVLFDQMNVALPIETQVARDHGMRDYEEQESALPFLIRAVAANFDRTHPVMRGLGDQAMPFASFIRVDNEQLENLGLRSTVLMTTSDRSWHYNWRGGWLPQDLLYNPPRDDDDQLEWAGRLPLAILVEGAFPKPHQPLIRRGIDPQDSVSFADERGEATSLLIFGCSEMFKKHRLMDTDFRSDHLLLNAASFLALDDDLLSIMTHRRVPRGFDYIEPEERLAWRAIVVASGPALLLLFALGWSAWRSRNPADTLRFPRAEPGTTSEQSPAVDEVTGGALEPNHEPEGNDLNDADDTNRELRS